MEEIWKDVPNYSGRYQVSNLGRVRSGSFIFKGTCSKKNNYTTVELKGFKRFLVHRLVLLVFVGNPEAGQVARHIDGNPKNNCLDNLCWGTHTENNQDKIKHGTITWGEKVNTAKLSIEKVLQIRKMASIGIDRNHMARMYNVGINCIYCVVNRVTWKYV